MKKSVMLVLAAVLLMGVLFAGAVSAEDPYLYPSEKTIPDGKKVTIQLKNSPGGEITWGVTNPDVLELVPTKKPSVVEGYVKAAGITNVTCTLPDGTKLECKVTVESLAEVSGKQFGSVKAAFAYAQTLSTPQTIKPTKDSTLWTGEISITSSNPITLDLNGYTLAGMKCRLFTVSTGATFILKDSSAEQTGKLTDGYIMGTDDVGGGVKVDGGTFIMKSGTIFKCVASGNNDGGGVGIINNGKFTMYGGNITHCTSSSRGGGVTVCYPKTGETKGVFTMYGGTIDSCETTGEGGGVHVAPTGRFIMTGGKIINCNAVGGGSGYGGGVVATENGNFTMYGGIITNCTGDSTSTTKAGGVRCYSKSGNIGFIVGGNATITGNKLNDGTEFNLFLDSDGATEFMKLAGKFTGRINISEPTTGQFGFAEADRFGRYPTGAENFVLDGVTNSIQVGHLNTNDGTLVWAEGCMVTFDPNNGEEVWDKPVEKNTAVAQPKNPTMKGYNFAGWYNGDEKWNFNTKVTEDLTLTAGWEKKTPYVPSSSGQTGYTVILTEAPTQVPTPTPTPTAEPTIQPIDKPSTNPTTNPTQKSPAPFVGLAAGLGAALVLTRLRK